MYSLKRFLLGKKQFLPVLFAFFGVLMFFPGKTKAQRNISADTVITVTMKNFKFVPNHLQIPAGEKVTLKFQNRGTVTHAFMAGNQLTENLKGFKDGLFFGVQVTKQVNGKTTQKTYGAQSLMLGVKPGKTATLTFTMPDSKTGSY